MADLAATARVPRRDLAPAFLGALALLVLPAALLVLARRGPTPLPRSPLQTAVDDRLPIVGARDGTSYVIRSVDVRTHSASRWYVDVGATARAKGGGYEGTVNARVPGAPCEAGRVAEVVGTSDLRSRTGDEGLATGDVETVAAAVARAATALGADVCASLPPGPWVDDADQGPGHPARDDGCRARRVRLRARPRRQGAVQGAAQLTAPSPTPCGRPRPTSTTAERQTCPRIVTG